MKFINSDIQNKYTVGYHCQEAQGKKYETRVLHQFNSCGIIKAVGKASIPRRNSKNPEKPIKK